MAVSKRTRFEVLRRDDYTCRYCRTKDSPLVVDHVVAVALGGPDSPENLVAACRDCNAGKSSTTVDAALVAQVDEDALRWARAIAAAAENVQEASDIRAQFVDYVFEDWTSRMPSFAELPDDWDVSAWNFYKRGLPMCSIEEAITIAAAASTVAQRARWKYFCGICWAMLRDLENDARRLIETRQVR